MVCVKYIIYIDEDKIMKQTAFCRKQKPEIMQHVKSSVHFHVAKIFEMNFRGDLVM
jgi:hypothetical protein